MCIYTCTYSLYPLLVLQAYLFVPFGVRFLDALYEALGEKLVIHRAHFVYIHTPDTARYTGRQLASTRD